MIYTRLKEKHFNYCRRQNQHFLTFDGVKEVEEGVVGHLLGDGAHGAAAFVLLLLLDGFHRDVLPLVPVYLTAARKEFQRRNRGNRRTCPLEGAVCVSALTLHSQ